MQYAFPGVEFADPLDEPHPVASLALDQVFYQRPEMKLARQGVEQACANLRLQEADAKPDPDAFLGYKHTFRLRGSSDFATGARILVQAFDAGILSNDRGTQNAGGT